MSDGASRPGLRIATYNVHGCFGLDGRYAPDRIAKVVNEIAPDVIGLQEVDNRRPWHEGFHQFDFLRHRIGMSAIPGASIVEERGEYGNVLLTRLPVIAVTRLNLSVPEREPRGAIDVVLKADFGLIRVISTHLGLKPAERRLQIERLLAAVESPAPAADPILATLLIGDFNEWLPRDCRLRDLTERFSAGFTRPTWPAHMPLLSLDRIYVHPAPRVARLQVHTGEPASRASDHLPLSVDMTW